MIDNDIIDELDDVMLDDEEVELDEPDEMVLQVVFDEIDDYENAAVLVEIANDMLDEVDDEVTIVIDADVLDDEIDENKIKQVQMLLHIEADDDEEVVVVDNV